MNGSHAFAIAEVLDRVRPGLRVLDAGCGESPIARLMADAGALVTAIDIRPDVVAYQFGRGIDARVMDFTQILPAGPFDMIVAPYTFQHCLDREAVAWFNARQVVADDGRLLYIARHRRDGDREYSRKDPLNGHSVSGARSLGMATGWRMGHYVLCAYDDERWESGVSEDRANAMAVEFKPWT